jgi:hypothetical protein
MPEGRLAEWIDFAAKPAAGNRSRHTPCAVSDGACCFRLEIQGRVAGRLEFFGPKVIERNVLRLGALRQGEPVRATVLMKINDPRRRLSVERIETEPTFLKARLVPYATGSKQIGLYRLEVEVPADAPMGAFLGPSAGVVRIRTDHPRLPTIELRVDFAVEDAASGRSAP